ncbi:MAG: dihydroxy-acid dehydratase [Halanaerobiales bacterium]|nr:dihydroxy-acid dehydratase [Halanaerobiales bacterium]
MEKKLRSNFKVGSLPWAARRAHWRALGYTDEDMQKPKIAIVNSSSELALCFTHLDQVAKRMKEAIMAAGGLAFEIRTAAPSDFITAVGKTGGYIQSTRDLIVNDIEVAVEGAQLDGMVCLASCDKTAPAQLMAAARLNIPTLVVGCGYQPGGKYKGEHIDIEDVFVYAGHHAAGKLSLEELTEMTETAIQGPGVCPGMGTANSMHGVSEALGMALPGSTPVLANSSGMWKTVRLAGERIVQMVEEDLKPRDIMTPEAFENAVKLTLAVSGSTNTIKHLQAVAKEAEYDLDVFGLFKKFANEVPLLTAVRPNGEVLIEEYQEAGGTLAMLKQLEKLLNKKVITVTGKILQDELKDVVVADPEIIRPLDRPLSTRPAIVLVKGNLAPNVGVVKLAVKDDRPLHFTGPATIYESKNGAIEALRNGDVEAGQVLVLRGFGLKGNPGLGFLSSVIFALDGAGLTGKVAVVTDGHVSGLVNKTLLVGEISPEAAIGGPLALVKESDKITIDVEQKRVDLDISEEEFKIRSESIKDLPFKEERGWLSIYRGAVKSMKDGAILGE